MKNLKDKQIRIIIAVLSLLLFIYVSLRAYFVSFTIDESYTYLNYVRGSWQNLYQLTYTNNHLLNSWLMKWSSIFFGNGEFALRLPNLLSYVLFLYYGAQLLFRAKDKRVIIAGFLFLNLNPYVLDFFSLARGYGISMGLMMMSIYYLYSLFYFDRSVKNILFAIFPMCLAVLANLTMINCLISLILLTIAVSLIPGLSPRVNGIVWIRNKWKIALITVSLMAAFSWFMIPIYFRLQHTGNFDFGGNTGLWQDTIDSLIGNSFYGTHFWHSLSFDLNEMKVLFLYFIYYLIEAIVIISFASYFFGRLYFLYTNRSIRPEGFLWFLFMILLFCVLAIWAQHQFFHIPFAQDRAAIYLIPLFSCFFIFWMDTIVSKFNKNIWITIASSVSLILFLPAINLNYCHWWKQDAGINEMMHSLSMDLDGEHHACVNAGVDPIYRPIFNYYRLRYKLWDLEPSNDLDVCEKGKYDYFLVPFDGSEKFEGKQIDFDPYSEVTLFKAKRQWNVKNKKQFLAIDYENPNSGIHKGVVETGTAFDGTHMEVTNAEHDFASNFSDTIVGAGSFKRSWINFEIKLKRTNAEAEGVMVISIERNGKSILWKNMNIREFVAEENKWTDVRFATYLTDDIQDGDVLKCFFWNQSKFDIDVDHQTLEIYQKDK